MANDLRLAKYHMPKLSKIIFNGSVIKDFVKILYVFKGNLKVGKPMLCCFFFQTEHIPS